MTFLLKNRLYFPFHPFYDGTGSNISGLPFLFGQVCLQNVCKFFIQKSLKSYLLLNIFGRFGLMQILTFVDFANLTPST